MRIAHYHNVLMSTREALCLVLLLVLCMAIASCASWIMGWYMGKSDEAIECPERAVSVAVWHDHLDCVLVVVPDPAAVRQHKTMPRKRRS